MKVLALSLLAFFPASLLSTSVAADPSAGASGPHAKTDWAMACLVGLGPEGCEIVFKSAEAAYMNTTYCTAEYLHPRLDGCRDGPLETVDYLGTNEAGADVYELQYMHYTATYVIAPPGPDGKIPRFWISSGPPTLIRVTSPVVYKMTLYRRPGQ